MCHLYIHSGNNEKKKRKKERAIKRRRKENEMGKLFNPHPKQNKKPSERKGKGGGKMTPRWIVLPVPDVARKLHWSPTQSPRKRREVKVAYSVRSRNAQMPFHMTTSASSKEGNSLRSPPDGHGCSRQRMTPPLSTTSFPSFYIRSRDGARDVFFLFFFPFYYYDGDLS